MRQSAYFLLVLGLLQITGDVLASPALRGLGAATLASPAPRVFTSRAGVEGFSSRFFIDWMDRDGGQHSMELTPERYARLRGPYNRRNVYGAALAGGPALRADPALRPMWDAVASRALCGDAPLLRELGIDAVGVDGSVRLRLQTRAPERSIVLEAPCR